MTWNDYQDLRTVTPAEPGTRAFMITDTDTWASPVVLWAASVVWGDDTGPEQGLISIVGYVMAGADGLEPAEGYYSPYFDSYLAPGEPEPAAQYVAQVRAGRAERRAARLQAA